MSTRTLALEGPPRTPNVNNTLTNKQQMKMDRLGIGGSHVSSWKKDMFNEEGYQVMECITCFFFLTIWMAKHRLEKGRHLEH
jgi:hypothetical protein